MKLPDKSLDDFGWRKEFSAQFLKVAVQFVGNFNHRHVLALM